MAEELSYRLEKFEGPLDLLLHLIEKNKINIYDIPIAEITDQYMAYMAAMDHTDLELVSSFLVTREQSWWSGCWNTRNTS